MSTNKFEVIYEAVDETADILKREIKCTYLDAVVLTCNNIISNKIAQSFSDDVMEKLKFYYDSIKNIDLNSEEVRKALQLVILGGFKELKLSNGELTPDSIGYIISYLVSKFYPENLPLRVFDPVIGTGNLLTTVANNLSAETTLFGIDNSELMMNLCKITCEMQGHDIELSFQDSLLATYTNMDLVLFDSPIYSCIEEDGLSYFPFLLVKRHLEALKDDKYLIGVIPNDFFVGAEAETMRSYLHKKAQVVGLIELPETIFKENNKSIIVLKKNGIEPKITDTLVVKVPSLNDEQALQATLVKVDMWFEKNKSNKNKKEKMKNGKNSSN